MSNQATNKKRKGIISIDFWNTIVDGRTNGEKRNEVRLAALSSLAAKSGKRIDPTALKLAYKKASEQFDAVWLGEQRTLTTTELVEIVLLALDISALPNEIEALAKVYAESLWDGPPSLAVGIKPALQALAENYDLGIISDTMYSPGTVLRVFLEREGILKYFKAFVFSDEVGFSKPDIRAFESIKKQLDSPSSEKAYHIGDLQKTDVKGANNAGYVSIQYIGLNPDEPTSLATHVVHSWEEISVLVGN